MLQSYRDSGGNQVPLYILQDANYNVVALLDGNGQVIEQYVWSPYGQLILKDTLATPAPENAVGHQGLFFFRFDAAGGDQATFTAGADGLYYNRNRWYSPTLGRFTTKDPNGTGQLILSDLATRGDGLPVLVSPFDSQSHFADGLNPYGYVRGNPITGSDASGLLNIGQEILLGASGIGKLEAFCEIVEDRNSELERFLELAAVGEIDAALADWEDSQLERWDQLRRFGRDLDWVFPTAEELKEELAALPRDFYTGPKVYTVYVGYDSKTKKAAYAGSTKQRLETRESQHGGKYRLRSYMSRLTKKQARSIEQVLIEKNPHFNNKINAVSNRRSWFDAGRRWAMKQLRGRRTKFR